MKYFILMRTIVFKKQFKKINGNKFHNLNLKTIKMGAQNFENVAIKIVIFKIKASAKRLADLQQQDVEWIFPAHN